MKEIVDPGKCNRVYAEQLEFLKELPLETEKEWATLRRDLEKQNGLNRSEADAVFKSLRKAMEGDLAPLATIPTTTTASTTVTTTETTDEDWIATPDWPGYAVDTWSRLKDLAGGKGRKAGRIISQTRVGFKKPEGEDHEGISVSHVLPDHDQRQAG